MHADGHHFRCGGALFVQAIKVVFQVLEELFAMVKAIRRGKLHVVAVEGVRHDEVRFGFAFTIMKPIVVVRDVDPIR